MDIEKDKIDYFERVTRKQIVLFLSIVIDDLYFVWLIVIEIRHRFLINYLAEVIYERLQWMKRILFPICDLFGFKLKNA